MQSSSAFMATVSMNSDFVAQEEEICHCSTFSPICHDMMGPDAVNLVVGFFLIFYFKLTFLLSSFTFLKTFFHSSSLSGIRVVSSAYVRLLTFLLPLLGPT